MNEQSLNLPVELSSDLHLRFATEADTDALADFNHRLHDENQDYDRIGALTRHFLKGRFPLMQPQDFTVVVKRDSGEIVSSMCLISQVWTYGGVPFRFGRPELVGTLPEYRRHGLVRRQFDVIHALSQARGELMLGITGIPWFYRQFGYEMAMHLGGERRGYLSDFPDYDAESDPYQLHPATQADQPFIHQLYEQASLRRLYAPALDDTLWQYFFTEQKQIFPGQMRWLVLRNGQNEPLGYIRHAAYSGKGRLVIEEIELLPGVGYLSVVPCILNTLGDVARSAPTYRGGDEPITYLLFRLGVDHPFYGVWPEGLNHQRSPYAWYIRIPDLVAFLEHVRPALDRHLAMSPAASYTGELKIHDYHRGLQLTFSQGRVDTITTWESPEWYEGDAAFPDLTFLQLLCGRRSSQQLADEHADCRANEHARVLLDALFPSMTHATWVIG